MHASRLTGLVLAAAAAALFATAPLAGQDDGHAQGKCYGVNSCKGKSSCKSSSHGCQHQNACKGQGFVSVSKVVCDQLGGRFEADKP